VHHPLHTVVLLYLLMVAVPSVLLLLLMAGQTLGGRLRRQRARGGNDRCAQLPVDGFGGVVDRPAQQQPDAVGGQPLDDVAGVTQGSREPVELGDHKNATRESGGQRLAQAPADTGGAGQAVVDANPGGVDPQERQASGPAYL
jgi:hypothetical protein